MTTEFNWSAPNLSLSGEIHFDNAEQVYQDGLKLLKQASASTIYLDLSGFKTSNSISLAVFVQWIRYFEGRVQLKLINIPEKMRDIIQASSLLEELT